MTPREEIAEAFRAVQNTLEKGLQATGSEDAIIAMQHRFENIYDAIEANEDYVYLAQETIANFFIMHPNLTHVIPRELLWRLGGSCLHFLTDDEIAEFTRQEEQLH
ncbi:PA2817 family protein [Aliamphritea spongicola]|uniref:PA2817 family protein n=1 Tax=Aliamphritea spongicola TaxID=707589 RepID=UPI00196AE096|nr:PA2817 family protein [Aliamphritea spongicola]MBN3562637.1 hypothetical protein [Aliamphritea spongicola]